MCEQVQHAERSGRELQACGGAVDSVMRLVNLTVIVRQVAGLIGKASALALLLAWGSLMRASALRVPDITVALPCRVR